MIKNSDGLIVILVILTENNGFSIVLGDICGLFADTLLMSQFTYRVTLLIG